MIIYIPGPLCAVARGLPRWDAALRVGEWPSSHGIDLEGRTMGILRLGAIGCHVARPAAGFVMRVVAWGPSLTAAMRSLAQPRICAPSGS